MEANGIIWEKDKHPVDIENYGGDEFINPYRISARLKGAGLTHLGLMVDADDAIQIYVGEVLETLVYQVFLIFLSKYQK